MRYAALVAGLCLAAAVGSDAMAQIQQLPETSRSEAQVNSLNRSMMQQEQSRAASQQNQFETNALRNQIQSAPMAPPPIAPPVRVGR